MARTESELLGLLVLRMQTTEGAELLELDLLGVGPLVLGSRVVTTLARLALEGEDDSVASFGHGSPGLKGRELVASPVPAFKVWGWFFVEGGGGAFDGSLTPICAGFSISW
jgi:hypothetical protein